MVDPIRIGIVGAGYSRAHIEAFQSLPEFFSVQALCDLDLNRARSLAEETHIIRVTGSLEELLKMDEVDAVDIVTPSHLHHSMALQGLNAGKHVILEKPVGASLKQVDELMAAERTSGKRLMPIFQYRFGSGVQKLKYLQSLGLTGQTYLSTVETCWRRRSDYYDASWHGKWATELGGPIISLAIHAHDVLNYVIGSTRSVFARTKTLVNPIETEDTISASLEMLDGSLASLSVTTGSVQQISRHRFCFSQLCAESNSTPYQNTSDPWTFTGDTPDLQSQIDTALQDFIPQPEGFTGQFLRYALAMQTGTELPVTLADARSAIELATALYTSARENRAVELPILPDHPMYLGWF